MSRPPGQTNLSPTLYPSPREGVIQEQIVLWKATGWSPARAMGAMRVLYCATRPPTWEDVEEVMGQRMAAIYGGNTV